MPFTPSPNSGIFPSCAASRWSWAGAPNSRGVVATCSYEARVFGIRSAMPASHSRRLCPEVIFVKPRFDVYRCIVAEIQPSFCDFDEA